jgi:hypothetical protein
MGGRSSGEERSEGEEKGGRIEAFPAIWHKGCKNSQARLTTRHRCAYSLGLSGDPAGNTPVICLGIALLNRQRGSSMPPVGSRPWKGEICAGSKILMRVAGP